MERLDRINDAIDLRDIFCIIRRRSKVIVILTLTAMIVSGIFSFFVLPDIYETKAILLVTQAVPDNPTVRQDTDGLTGMMNSISKLPEMTINTYVEQLKSEAVLDKVLKELKLDKKGYTVRSLAGSIEVTAVKDTNLIEVRASGTDPHLTANVVNTLSRKFSEFISNTSQEQMGKSVDFLKEQLANTSHDLQSASNKLIVIESQPRSLSMLEQLITEKTGDLSKYQSDLLQANMEYKQLLAGKRKAENELSRTPATITTTRRQENNNTVSPGSGSPTDPVVMPEENEGIDSSSTQPKIITSSVVTQTEEVNPAYTDLQKSIGNKSVLLAEKQTQVKNLQVMIDKLNVEVTNLQLEAAQKKSKRNLAAEEVKSLEETNALLRTKIDEAKIGKSLKFGDTSVVLVSQALVPSQPVKPNKILNIGVSFVIALVASIGLALLLNHFDNTIKTSKEIEEVLGLPVLGQVPIFKLNKLEV